jgi:hypothetical protein
LGEAEKALNCNKETPYFDSELAHQAQALQTHLDKCSEARKINDWKVILKETKSAISLGADSAPKVSFLCQIFSCKFHYRKYDKFCLCWLKNGYVGLCFTN